MKIGIIGCGKIAEKRAKFLKENLFFCYDIDLNKAKNFAKRFNCNYAYSLDEILSPKASDALIVSCSTGSLFESAKKALESKKHVLIEKPAGKNSDEIGILIELAKSNNLTARVGFNHRYHPAFQKAKELIFTDKIGDLMFITGAYGHGARLGYEKEWHGSRESGGGELLDQGVHLIDLSRWIFNEEFCKINGASKTYFWDMDVEDNGFMVLETKAGKIASLSVSCTEWRNTFSFNIYGKKGKLSINGLGGSYGSEKLTYYKMNPSMGLPEVYSWEFLGEDLSWKKEMEDFFEDIELKRDSLQGLYDAFSAIKIVERIRGF